jgi:hypothetical protein
MKAIISGTTLFLSLILVSLGQDDLARAAVELRLGPAPERPSQAMPAKLSDETAFPGFLAITNRETSRQFFNTVHAASEGVAMEWSGNYANCVAGTNSGAYLQSVLRRLNYFRAMAGVPAGITFSNEYTRKAQLAALMMGANMDIDHFPPPTWLCYTADGANAAQNSNLALGHAGPDAIDGLIRDNGNNNAAAGHRRWMLYPQTQKMGSGNVPVIGPNPAASVLWVFDTHTFDLRPATRETFVAWPPPGYVPYQVTYPRWSFACAGADLSASTISMASNGVPMAVSLEALASGFGENTLVWVPAGLNANSMDNLPRPATDTVYHVTINNVRIAGVPQSFSYDVRVFDPAVAGADYFPPIITGPTQVLAGVSTAFNFSAVSNANGYQFRQSRLASGTFADGAENGLTNFTVQAATNLYNVRDNVVRQSGAFSFHLTHTQAVRQTLTLNRLFRAATNSTLTFHSRLGWATSVQVAKVQLSIDDGASWADVYSQPGSGGSGETGFTLRTVPLGAYAGQTVRLRLNYDFSSGSYYPQASSGVGWYVDNFAVANAAEVLASTITDAATLSSFLFTSTNTGAHLLEVRPLLFGDFPSAWGPGRIVDVVPNANALVRIIRIEKAGATDWHIDFILQNGSPVGYELWSTHALGSAFTKELVATIQPMVPGVQYRATVTSANATRFFVIKPL